ncbi:hypothetical protein E8E14_003732 [Neopestalotiopsis sp. 37M]|nr:hypothetical protein E8E14_003732 [Neopestalotiopsis sp. 37M]
MPARRTTKDEKNQEDQEEPAEPQREDEAIRVMWAADREATARVALSFTAPQQVFAMSSVGGRAVNVSTERAHSPRRSQDESPISTQDSDNDLIASLELQLESDSRSKMKNTVDLTQICPMV